MGIHCCYGCTAETGRSSTCHGICKTYLGEKAKHDKEKAEARKRADCSFYDYARQQAVRKNKLMKKYYMKG